MPYKITTGDQLIYDSQNKNGYPCIEPILNMELGEAGNLSFTLLPGHPMRKLMREMQTFVSVYQDDIVDPIFYGRVLMAEEDIIGQLNLTCEGALTFLLDSEMDPGTYTETISEFFARCINAHNALVEEAKQFQVGEVIHDQANVTMEFKMEGYNQTRQVLDNLLIKKIGGFLNVRYQDGNRYLDLIQVFQGLSNQPIRVGQNVITLQKRTNGENIFTVLRPIGDNNLTIENITVSDLLTGVTLVNGAYLAENESEEETPAEITSAIVVAQSGSTVNLRSSKSTSSSVLVQVPLGTEVPVLDHSDDEWWQVTYNNNTGYMMTEFLQPVLSNSSEVVTNDEEWCYTSNFISIEGDKYYTSGPSPVKVIYYDSNHAILYAEEENREGTSLHYLKTPDDAAYIKLSFKAEYATDQQLHEGKLPILVKYDAGLKMLLLPERRAKYGQIVHSEKFSDVTTAQELYEAALKWLSIHFASLPLSIECNVIDLHLLNPNIRAFKIGDIYDSIEGFADEIMTIASKKINMEDPADDHIILKNMSELFGANVGSSTGSLSSKFAKR